MITKTIIWLSDILHIIIFGFLVIIFLLNISAVTVKHIENRDLNVEIQRRGAVIEALLITGKVDAFIVQTHSEEEKNEHRTSKKDAP